ncbi:hypothetical protein [Pelagerythrobacter marinus]|uniref:hypothetical protein n=1 Tax=Pelagerythrobacter marinus TaxID=538382 RepID=UPI002AC8AF56|nr:hypothetical protein [Pelagerythrobacter marinus]WPZ07617.1 hypothetical protein T8T98_03635 [Pelagerythrobacter marinus]
MTNQSPRTTAHITGFSAAAAEVSQAGQTDARRAGTSEERKILALEMIADQLALIHADLCSIDDFARADAASCCSAPDSLEDAEQDRWDNEGGRSTDELAEDDGVIRSMEQHYAVGGYRYTNLQHAIAEAKRARGTAASGE